MHEEGKKNNKTNILTIKRTSKIILFKYLNSIYNIKMDKSTHGFEELTLWQPVVKSNEGKYIAILSDTSIDRDDEIIGKDALQSIIDNDGYTAILVNHENKIQNQIGEWVNKRLETIGEHTALVAEPKFYLSNPQAK